MNKDHRISCFNMRALTLYLCMLFSVLISSEVLAGAWSAQSPVVDLQASGSAIYVRLDVNIVSNINNCSNWSGWFRIANGTYSMDDFERMRVSVALAAQTSGKNVKIYSSGCDNSGYNTLNSIQINPN